MTSEAQHLLDRAIRATDRCRQLAANRDDWTYMGYVGSALVTTNGNEFSGINVDLLCGIGFCAEHSAVADMLEHGESSIRMIVAATADGEILPPCGRCREMLFQVDGANLETSVVMPGLELVTLRDLLPYNWQDFTAAVAAPADGGGDGQR